MDAAAGASLARVEQPPATTPSPVPVNAGMGYTGRYATPPRSAAGSFKKSDSPARRRSSNRSIFDARNDKLCRVIRSLATDVVETDDCYNGYDSLDEDMSPPPRDFTPERPRHMSSTMSADGAAAAVRRLTLDDDTADMQAMSAPRGSAPLPWFITTRTVTVSRAEGTRLGMVVYSERGSYGTRVESVKPGSPADKAGLLPEDVFVRLDNEYVLHCDHRKLVDRLSTMPQHFTVEVAEREQLPTAKGKYLVRIRDAPHQVAGPLRASATLAPTNAPVSPDECFQQPAFRMRPLSHTSLSRESVGPQSP
eukprot:m.185758 g.185758  ORF g.185758 m.185758 type:complete len:308 (+) comp16553_c0_seq1:140-1063(+)